jgi:hypothetical protein
MILICPARPLLIGQELPYSQCFFPPDFSSTFLLLFVNPLDAGWRKRANGFAHFQRLAVSLSRAKTRMQPGRVRLSEEHSGCDAAASCR